MILLCFVSIEPRTIDVEIEEKITEEFRVEPEINNSLIAEDYILKSMTATHTVIVEVSDGVISNIEISDRVWGDDGLGDYDPSMVFTEHSYFCLSEKFVKQFI